MWLVGVLVVVAIGSWWYLSSTPGTTETPATQTTQGGQQATGATGSNSTGGSQSASGPKTYANPAFAFSFQYPASAPLETSGLAAGGLEAQGAIGVVAVYTQMGTVVDRLTVSVSKEPVDVGACMTKPSTTSSTATINGVPFLKYQTQEDVQGKVVTTTTYRTVHNSTCYELLDVVTSTTANQLSVAEIETQRANVAAASALIASIIQSFRFSN